MVRLLHYGGGRGLPCLTTRGILCDDPDDTPAPKPAVDSALAELVRDVLRAGGGMVPASHVWRRVLTTGRRVRRQLVALALAELAKAGQARRISRHRYEAR
jgi:hypothetical protein